MLRDSAMMGFIPTTDADGAKAFYCDVLGLEFVEDSGFAVILRGSQGLIRLTRVAEFSPFPFTLLGWSVTDIAGQVKEFSTAGVAFERYSFLEQDELGIWAAPGGAKVAWFKDPDGNVLSLTQD